MTETSTTDQTAFHRILADADHHNACANRSAGTHPDAPELAAVHSGMAGGLYIAATHLARGNPALVAELKQRIDQPRPAEPTADGYCPHCGRGDAGPTADQYEASRRRAVTLVERIDAARAWGRHNLTAEQQTGLLTVLRGGESEPTVGCGSCGASPVTYYAPDGLPACVDCAPCDCGTEPCSKPAALRGPQWKARP